MGSVTFHDMPGDILPVVHMFVNNRVCILIPSCDVDLGINHGEIASVLEGLLHLEAHLGDREQVVCHYISWVN